MIAEYYQKYDAQKGTQFVFSDLMMAGLTI